MHVRFSPLNTDQMRYNKYEFHKTNKPQPLPNFIKTDQESF